MDFFSNDSITVIRRKEYEYFKETITTKKMLPCSALSDDAIRKCTILRLRNDPSVLFVLEANDGKCHETADLHNGFEMTLDLEAGEHPKGLVTVTHGPAKEIAFKGGFGLGDEAHKEDEEEIINACLDYAIEIIEMIDMEDYSFVSEDCPGIDEETHDEYEDERKFMSLWDIEEKLTADGFQVEPILLPGGGVPPLLVVHENELIMIGSKHFNGEDIFVEKKRTFWDKDEYELEECKKKADREGMATIRHLKDGSWAFRNGVCIREGDSVMEKISVMLEDLDATIGCFCHPRIEPARIETYRQLFIYEVIDASLTLKALPI